MTPEQKTKRELRKRLFDREVRYKAQDREAVVETLNGQRRVVKLTTSPLNLVALTFGRRVFVKGFANIFCEVASEAFYSLPAGVPPEASYREIK